MKIDDIFYEKYGMDDYDYAKKLMSEKGISFSEAFQKVNKLMSEIYKEKYYGTEFRDITDKDDIPFNI